MCVGMNMKELLVELVSNLDTDGAASDDYPVFINTENGYFPLQDVALVEKAGQLVIMLEHR